MIVELRIDIVAPAPELNAPGNFRTAPFCIVNRAFAPATERVSFTYASIERGSVVTIELSRIRTPCGFTVREYWWAAVVSSVNFSPPFASVRLPPAFTAMFPSTV